MHIFDTKIMAASLHAEQFVDDEHTEQGAGHIVHVPLPLLPKYPLLHKQEGVVLNEPLHVKQLVDVPLQVEQLLLQLPH